MAPFRHWLIRMIGDDIRTIGRNTNTRILLNAYKVIGLAVNVGKKLNI
jgi:hypothetical protein